MRLSAPSIYIFNNQQHSQAQQLTIMKNKTIKEKHGNQGRGGAEMRKSRARRRIFKTMQRFTEIGFIHSHTQMESKS